jgi:hypothetical protein
MSFGLAAAASAQTPTSWLVRCPGVFWALGLMAENSAKKGERDLTRLRDAGLDSRVQQGCHLSSGLTMAAQLLFHRDPKRIVGVLRVTLLNRLNDSREWADLPLSR